MVPVLVGRIQTRLFLLALVGSVVTAIITPLLPVGGPLTERYRTTFVVLGAVAVLGLGWELLYHVLMQLRWEKDWPSLFGLLTGVPEGALVWLLLVQGAVPLLEAPPPTGAFLIHFAAVWVAVWFVANGPMRVPFLRWRFLGGQLVTPPDVPVRPKPAAGLVARVGDLVAICAPDSPRAEALSALVRQVAIDGGDGAELIRRAFVLLRVDGPDCAVGGATAGGGAAVLVYGRGTAEVTGPRRRIQLSGPALQHRVVTPPVDTLRLALPAAGSPDHSAAVAIGVTIPRQRQPCSRPAAALAAERSTTASLVEGVFCKKGHFNDPTLPFCQLCGISMAQSSLATALAPRPPLGVLLLDDGTTFRLDADYVVGRDPDEVCDVADRPSVRSLRVAESESGVSRLHLQLSLVGWHVEVVDLHSVTGTFVQLPGDPEPQPVRPGAPVTIRPGARIEFGARWLRYESHRNP